MCDSLCGWATSTATQRRTPGHGDAARALEPTCFAWCQRASRNKHMQIRGVLSHPCSTYAVLRFDVCQGAERGEPCQVHRRGDRKLDRPAFKIKALGSQPRLLFYILRWAKETKMNKNSCLTHVESKHVVKKNVCHTGQRSGLWLPHFSLAWSSWFYYPRQ